MTSWIDFKELRSKLRFEDVLRHYKVELKGDGPQRVGRCPLPKHVHDRRPATFSANLDKGIFQCFACKSKGNLLDFAAYMEGEDPNDGRGLKKAALRLRSALCNDEDEGRSNAVAEMAGNQLEMAAVVNAPLDFELKGLDPEHAYFRNAGFSPGTVAHFGLGYCSRGTFAGRIAIPLRDAAGRLVGYAGRLADDTDAQVTAKNPKYLMPKSRTRDGKELGFRESLFLYNGYRMNPPCESVVVVQGFPAVWWLYQNGFPNVVATMGAECSLEQTAAMRVMLCPTLQMSHGGA